MQAASAATLYVDPSLIKYRGPKLAAATRDPEKCAQPAGAREASCPVSRVSPRGPIHRS